MLGRRALFGSALSSLMAAVAAHAAAKEDLIIGTTQAPGTMNPLISSMLARALIQGMTLRPFTAYDADWRLVCLACTRLPNLKEGTARVIELPDGGRGMEIDVEIMPLVWGDGVPVTTKDVAFTLAIGKHPLSGVASAEGYRRILKLDIKDDRRFTATVDRITFDYDNVGLVVVPAHIEKPIFDADPAEYRNRTAYDTDPTNPGLGFGPYCISELVPGSRIALRQNTHWKGEPPYFKRITFKFIENNAALEANLLAGNIDYVLGELGLSLEQALAIEKRYKARYDVIYRSGLVYEHIDVNLDNPLVKDRRVRRAILMAIDWNAISEKLFEGKQPVADSDVSPLDPMYSAETPHYRYDPGKARQLLGEAGFATAVDGLLADGRGQRFSIELITTAGNRVREQIAQVIQSQLRQIGIELRIKALPPRIFSGTLNQRRFTGLAMYAWVQQPEGVPRTTLHSKEVPTKENGWSGQNYPGYANPAMDKALDAAERELDRDKRRTLFAEIQRLYADDLPVLPLYFRVDPFVIPRQLKGIRPTGQLDSSTLWVEQWRWEG